MSYDHKSIEQNWQKRFESAGVFGALEKSEKPKFYALMEFPYPSGAGLHVGHVRGYAAMDIIARKRRMDGYNVLYPIGWDAFGLPTENYAIKTGRKPADVTAENIATFKKQMKAIGLSFDWEREVNTSDPSYYKWTQWMFLEFFKAGLAYKKAMPINWCISCKIGLANEEVVGGVCERCGGAVEKRNKEQWMIRITNYADRLINDLEMVDYLEKIKKQQIDWIGRSEGAEIEFVIASSPPVIASYTKQSDVSVIASAPPVIASAPPVIASYTKQSNAGKEIASALEAPRNDDKRTALRNDRVRVFTTRPDTLFGATYLVLAPEHPLLPELLRREQRRTVEGHISNVDDVRAYIKEAVAKTDIERGNNEREKTGVELKGIKAINPATQEEITIWIADYVLPHYGTGAIMAVPAHDERDFAFAKKYNVPICAVVESSDVTAGAPPVIASTSPVTAGASPVIASTSPVTASRPTVIASSTKQSNADRCFSGEGINVNSDFLNGLKTADAKHKIIEWLEEKGIGRGTVQYKLRDWVFSRQRYWGEPIPLVWCDACAKKTEHKKESVHIFHGWMDTSASGFIPALKDNLAKKGYNVVAEEAPNTEAPNFDEWFAFGMKQLSSVHGTQTVVGHSMGGHLALKLAEKHKMKRLILVAPVGAKPSDAYFAQFEGKLNEEELAIFRAYQDHPLDAEAVKRNAEEIIFVFSNDDPWITSEIVEQYKKAFGGAARFIFVENEGHISHDSGCRRAPYIEALFDRISVSGWVPIPDDELPVTLPEVEKYEPTDSGESPLAAMEDWVNTKCPQCVGPARRETDTMPNWAGSSWYFLRYLDAHNKKAFAAPKKLAQWMPVDWYNGGMEHTTLHLLYSRFWNKFLYDRGHVLTSEPYAKRTSHGMILASDGSKMSKSKGNVVNPNDIIESHGADTLRLYEMFMGPFDQSVPWSEQGVVGVHKFLKRVFGLLEMMDERENADVTKALHKTIKKITEDVEAMRFNTAISQMMIFVNAVYDAGGLSRNSLREFVLILSPFAPHIAEELWEATGGVGLACTQAWPAYDAALVKDEVVTIGVQVNGKMRGNITLAADASEEEARQAALSNPNIAKHLEGKEIKKFLYIPARIVNVVVAEDTKS